ncbi:hypothetical protein B0H19DRAFT_1262322 [Mycena capillaripes]|nr:hypothetical protein B0H19DRAFT_1262322 [Mycena capillaripes]
MLLQFVHRIFFCLFHPTAAATSEMDPSALRRRGRASGPGDGVEMPFAPLYPRRSRHSSAALASAGWRSFAAFKHAGERPFMCHCTRQFSDLDNLCQHALTVHADKAALNEAMIHVLTSLHSSMTGVTPFSAPSASPSVDEFSPRSSYPTNTNTFGGQFFLARGNGSGIAHRNMGGQPTQRCGELLGHRRPPHKAAAMVLATRQASSLPFHHSSEQIEEQITKHLLAILHSKDDMRAVGQLGSKDIQSFLDAVQEVLNRGSIGFPFVGPAIEAKVIRSARSTPVFTIHRRSSRTR